MHKQARLSSVAARIKWLRALLLISLVVAAGCGDKAAQLPKLVAGDVIVAFCDSLTYGTGAAEHESYPAVLSQLIGHQVERAGVPGEVTAQGVRRLPDVIAEHRPALVILCLGGNDMLRKVGASEIKSNLRTMIKSIRDQGIAVVLVGVPQPALITSAPEFYAELAKEFAVPYEGKVVTSVLYSSDMKSDPIHPNAKGYRRIAEALAGLLRKSGAI